jgi:hypothetical protein
MYYFLVCLIFLNYISCTNVQNSQHDLAEAHNGTSIPSTWQPGTYKGLVVGKSTYQDMIKILGNPISSVPAADQEEHIIIWNDYKIIDGELVGRLGVKTDKRNNLITGISILPNNLNKDEVIRYFGNDYQITKYKFCDKTDKDEASPIFATSEDSDLEYLEYRAKGIIINSIYNNKVTSINFVSKPIGLQSISECPK